MLESGDFHIARAGDWNYIDLGTDYTDATVASSTSYTYTITLVSFHGVSATSSTTASVTTPPLGSIDPRRTGVKPQGTYWGGGGENIDMQSGNLNFTVSMGTIRPRKTGISGFVKDRKCG